MAHDHGNEYQVRCVHEDGTEALSQWIINREGVAQAMAALHLGQESKVTGCGNEVFFVPTA